MLAINEDRIAKAGAWPRSRPAFAPTGTTCASARCSTGKTVVSGGTSPSAIWPSAARGISATVWPPVARLSPARIQEALNALQISLLYETNGPRKFALPSRATRDARTIYRTLGLTWNTLPLHTTPETTPHPTTPHHTHVTEKDTDHSLTSRSSSRAHNTVIVIGENVVPFQNDKVNRISLLYSPN